MSNSLHRPGLHLNVVLVFLHSSVRELAYLHFSWAYLMNSEGGKKGAQISLKST